MKITLHQEIDEFLKVCGPSLEKNEVENGLMLGLVLRAQAEQQQQLNSPINLISIIDRGVFLGAGIQTPPKQFIFTRMAPEIIALVVDFLIANKFEFPGFKAPEPTISEFVKTWTQLTGRKPELAFKQMIYQLTEVKPPKAPKGNCYLASMDDLEIVTKWFYEFGGEALAQEKDDDLTKHRENAIRRIERKSIYLWKTEKETVSMAGISGQTPNGIRVNAVYTPPAQRGHGYASANVATISQLQLDAGRKYCFLYTDAANPTSNKIYQNIGYEFVCHSAMYLCK